MLRTNLFRRSLYVTQSNLKKKWNISFSQKILTLELWEVFQTISRVISPKKLIYYTIFPSLMFFAPYAAIELGVMVWNSKNCFNSKNINFRENFLILMFLGIIFSTRIKKEKLKLGNFEFSSKKFLSVNFYSFEMRRFGPKIIFFTFNQFV